MEFVFLDMDEPISFSMNGTSLEMNKFQVFPKVKEEKNLGNFIEIRVNKKQENGCIPWNEFHVIDWTGVAALFLFYLSHHRLQLFQKKVVVRV